MTLTPEQARELARAALGPTASDGVGPATGGNGGGNGGGSQGSGATRIGRYTIRRLINAGGMGEVFEAQQDEPRRVVALKLMRPDLVSPQATRRFQYESEMLGRLHHPGIARVYDAGCVETENGPRHYFAMELVRGKRLTAYVEDESLNIRQRLDLFLRVCDAVEHAHRKGVIHRDLKPANILVDEAGEPKVLDFGVARTTDADLQATTMLTDIGQLVGTLPYMSPEQVAGDPEELDTRSDVYSLGVVLYQMLSGRLPYEVSKTAIPEAVRTIREEEPSRLSSIDKSLGGDVETIVAKALEKEPERRYQSASDFAADIRRYLGSEPIVARKASTWYQARRFAGRNRGFVGGIWAAIIALTAGTAIATWQAAVANAATVRAQDAAEVALESAQEAESERAKAQDQVRVSNAVVTFLQDVFLAVNAGQEGRDATLAEGLAYAVERAHEDFQEDPAVEAAVFFAAGKAHRALGDFDEAEQHLRSCLEIRREIQGLNASRVADAEIELAMLLSDKGALEEAEPLARHGLMIRQLHLTDHDPDAIRARNNLAVLLMKLGNLDEAAELLEGVSLSQQELASTDPEELWRTTHNLAGLFYEQGNLDRAETMAMRAISQAKATLGETHLLTIKSQSLLAGVVSLKGDTNEAVRIQQEIVVAWTELYGANHHETITGRFNLAGYQMRAGQGETALVNAQASLDLALSEYGPSNQMTMNCFALNAQILLDLDRDDDAIVVLARGIQTATLGGERTFIAAQRLRRLLGECFIRQKRFEEAEEVMLPALSNLEESFGWAHRYTKETANAVADMYQLWGKETEAKKVRARLEGGGLD